MGMRITVAMAVASAALAAAPARAADGPVVAYFPAGIDAPAAISDLCIRRNIMIVEQDERHVVCSQEMGGLKGAFAQVLIGNSYSTTPTLNVRFSLSKTRDYTVVQGSQWIETQMAFGQTRREEINGSKNRRNLMSLLLSSGAYEAPPRPASAAVAAPEGTQGPAPLPDAKVPLDTSRSAALVTAGRTSPPAVDPSKTRSDPAKRQPDSSFGNNRVHCVTCR